MHRQFATDRYDIGVFDEELRAVEAKLTTARLTSPAMHPVLVAGMCDDLSCVRWVLRGVWGLVTYDRYESDLYRAVRHVAAGQLWFPPSAIIQRMRIESARQPLKVEQGLTDRECEVLDLLQHALSNKEIASLLRISERTVKFHVGNILGKLHLNVAAGPGDSVFEFHGLKSRLKPNSCWGLTRPTPSCPSTCPRVQLHN